VVGEEVKAELLPVAHGIMSPNQNIPPGAFQAEQSIKTQAPEGVTSLNALSPTDTQVPVATVTDKTAPEDDNSLDLASLVSSATTNVRPEDVGKFAQNIGHLSNNPRFSLDANQLFNLVSTQLTAQISQARNLSRLSFQLVPESLGKVTVQMVLVDQSLSARIFVSNPEVRDAVQTHLVDLKASLSQAGLQIDQLQVQVQGGGANLLAQYYQYQQEGSAYRGPVYEGVLGAESTENPENMGVLAASGSGLSLVDLLA
jgi:flagellar hook-length control protein FliK